jgi:deazaflavin-dependent oxidoreductase (nitroreductase family)
MSPLGRGVAHFNRRVTNRLTRPLAPWLPGFGVVVHVGRTSGRQYRTPVNVFEAQDGYAIALTYGREAEWVRNVLAAGGCQLIVRGRRRRVDAPEIVRDDSRQLVPAPIRPILGFLGVCDFLRVRASGR